MWRACTACHGEGSLASQGGPAGDCDFCDGRGEEYVKQQIKGNGNVQISGVECEGPIVARNGGSQVVTSSKIGGSIVQTSGDGFEVEVRESGVYINGRRCGDGVHVIGNRLIRVRGRNVQAQGAASHNLSKKTAKRDGLIPAIIFAVMLLVIVLAASGHIPI